MSRAPMPTAEYRPHRVGTLAFPWLLSSTLHAAVIVAFALSWPAINFQQAPAARGIMLDVSLLSGSGTDEGITSVEFDAPPAEGYYEDDEPLEFTPVNDTPLSEAPIGALATTTGGAPSLQSLLAEQPAVSSTGVLPAMPAEEPGLGGRTSGIASAASLTGEPAPARRLKGGHATTGVFGLEGEGYKFVYVFDRSGSMDGHGGAPLIAAKNELLKSLNDLGSVHQFQIIFYNEEPRFFEPGGRSGQLVFGTDQNKNLARRFVGSITASGATRHMEALAMALRLNPDVIFFLTDADEPRMTPRELAQIAQMNRGTTINTIEFGTDPHPEPDNFIVRLARQNGGQHVYIDVTRLGDRRRQVRAER
jgi:hypothetical protein